MPGLLRGRSELRFDESASAALRLGLRAMELEVYREKDLEESESENRNVNDKTASHNLDVVNAAEIFGD